MRFVGTLLAFVLAGAALTTAGGAAARGHHSAAYYSSAGSDYYTNVSGHHVHRPVFSRHAPSGWSARCGDGSYSFSEHRQGTCSHHGGVAQWR